MPAAGRRVEAREGGMVRITLAGEVGLAGGDRVLDERALRGRRAGGAGAFGCYQLRLPTGVEVDVQAARAALAVAAPAPGQQVAATLTWRVRRRATGPPGKGA